MIFAGLPGSQGYGEGEVVVAGGGFGVGLQVEQFVVEVLELRELRREFEGAVLEDGREVGEQVLAGDVVVTLGIMGRAAGGDDQLDEAGWDVGGGEEIEAAGRGRWRRRLGLGGSSLTEVG